MNSYEMLARERKAAKVANMIAPEWPRLAAEGYTLDDLLRPEAANARRIAEQQAGVNPASEETWKLIVKMLRDRKVSN